MSSYVAIGAPGVYELPVPAVHRHEGQVLAALDQPGHRLVLALEVRQLGEGGVAVRVGDLLMWDNQATMHRARSFEDMKYPRDLRRTTLTTGAPAIPLSQRSDARAHA